MTTSPPSNPSLAEWLTDDPQGVRDAISAELCRRSLAEFVRRSWHVLEPSTPLEWNWHLDAMCIHLEAAYRDWMAVKAEPGRSQRLRNVVFNVPPGSGKSRVISVGFCAWAWVHDPSWRVICLSSNPRVAMRDSLYCRSVIESPWYRRVFRPDWRLAPDQNAKGHYHTTAGGFRLANGITARIVGTRGDCLLIDDPNDPYDPLGSAACDDINERYTDSIHNRVNDLRTSIRIGVQQRIRSNDWTGHVEAGGDWVKVSIPQEYEPDAATTTPVGWRDPRTEAGELMFPGRFTREVVEAEKKRLGPYAYAGQHQQRPAAREGAMFPDWALPIVDQPPAGLTLARYWDTAGAAIGKGDHTAGCLMGRESSGRYWVLDVRRFQLPADQRDAAIRAAAEADRSRYGRVAIYVERPPGLAKESTEAIIRNLDGFAATADPVSGKKEDRAEPLSSACRAGNVKIVRDTPDRRWNHDFLAEMAGFPLGAHDDQCDAAAGAFNRLASTPQWRLSIGGPDPSEDDDD